MNVFARFDEIPLITLQDIMEQNVTDRGTDGWMDTRENSIPIH